MDKYMRRESLRLTRSWAFIVIGKYNYIKKCSCGGRYFKRLEFIGDEQREPVVGTYICWDCEIVHEDHGWMMKVVPHKSALRKVVKR